MATEEDKNKLNEMLRTSMTGGITGSPVTTGPIMSAQSVQPRKRVTWRRS